MKYLYFTFALLLLVSCKPEGVEEEKNAGNPEIINGISKKEREEEMKRLSLKPIKKIGDKKLSNGIKITYFIHGEGPKLQDGEVAKINYEVLLKDGKMVDGNKLLNKEWLPFLVGFGMQTPGWDIAFRELKVGDFVEIYLPGDMARGKNGIKGLIPPNAENFIRIKVVGTLKPTKVIDGTKVWLLEENKDHKPLANEESEIIFHYMVTTSATREISLISSVFQTLVS